MKGGRPATTKDLLPSERSMLDMIRTLGFGQIEFLRISAGEPVVDPWPTVVRDVKLGTERYEPVATGATEFDLKREAADLFEYMRDVDAGEIRCLVVRHGLPFSMEVELAGRALRAPLGRRQ